LFENETNITSRESLRVLHRFFCNRFFCLRRWHEFACQLFAASFRKRGDPLESADKWSANLFLDLQEASAATFFSLGYFHRCESRLVAAATETFHAAVLYLE